MHFTSNQKKAILFIAVVFLLAVIYHWVDKALHPVETYDFSRFEEKFHSRFDSIQTVLSAGSGALDNGGMKARLMGRISGDPEPGVSQDQKKQPSSTQKKSLAPGQRININTATVDELTLLPRIGPKTAAKIIDYRNLNGDFATKKDITNVKGIGAKTYQKLKDLIKVE